MEPIVAAHLLYLAISIGLTVLVATTLRRKGRVFLVEDFGDEAKAAAVNDLLVVSFYLLSLGFVALWATTGTVATSKDIVDLLSIKIGVVALVLGGLHTINLIVFHRWRERRRIEEAFEARRSTVRPASHTA